jgi:hypothetical protein
MPPTAEHGNSRLTGLPPTARCLRVPALSGVSAADPELERLKGSANLIWQLRKRHSVDAEGLYGRKEAKDRSDGDVFRFQLGLDSIFD